MKKTLLILDSLDKMFPTNGKIHGGANRIGRYLIEYFAKLPDIELDIICGTASIQQIKGVKNIITLGFCPFSNMDDFFKKIKQHIDKNNYDVVFTSDLFPPFGNILVHSHTIMYKNKNCKNVIESLVQSFLRREKVKKFKAIFKDKNRKIFTVSKKLAQDYVENLHFSPKNVICVYPGTDQKTKSSYNPQSIFTFGIIAGNAINKGGYLFLFAALLLKIAGKNFKAKIIAPQNSLMQSFINILKLNDKIEILPEQDGLSEFYGQIDCLILPSLNEAFGLVVTEAASEGKPSLVSSTAGSAEIINDGENGFIFKRSTCICKSLFNLTKKMSQIIDMPAQKFQQISENAYTMSTNYVWDGFFEKITQELKLTL